MIGVVLGGGVPFLIGEIYYRVRRIEGLGMGDVKMLGMIGAFLGWQLALFTLFFASMVGVAVGIPLTRIKGDRNYQNPARHVPRPRRTRRRLRRRSDRHLVRRTLPVNAQGLAFLGLTALVGGLVALLAFTAMRFAAAARDTRRHLRDAGSETAILSAALQEAVTKLRTQERAMAARAEASERLSSRDRREHYVGTTGRGPRWTPAHPEPGRPSPAGRVRPNPVHVVHRSAARIRSPR